MTILGRNGFCFMRSRPAHTVRLQILSIEVEMVYCHSFYPLIDVTRACLSAYISVLFFVRGTFYLCFYFVLHADVDTDSDMKVLL